MAANPATGGTLAERDMAERHCGRAIWGAAAVVGLAAGLAVGKPPAKKPGAVAAAGEVTSLGEPFGEFHAAAGGRVLAFYEPKAAVIAVYDAVTGKQTGTIPVAGDDPLFACGADCVVVASPADRVVNRYDLSTLKRTRTAPLPPGDAIRQVRMGNASAGPVYVYGGDAVVALDGTTLAPLKLKGELPTEKNARGFDCRVSADGTMLTTWDGNRLVLTRVRDGAATTAVSPEHMSTGNRKFYPTADGSVVLYERRAFTADGRPIGAGGDDDGQPRAKDQVNAVPTSDPRFYFRVQSGGKGRGAEAMLCATATRQPLATVTDLGNLGDGGRDLSRLGATWEAPDPGEPRVIYLPDAKLVVTVPAGDEQFARVKLDVDALMTAGATGSPPLAVVSVPPATVLPGKAYAYTIQVLPAGAAVTYKLESGPDGMTVSAAGAVAWTPAAGRPDGDRAQAIVSVTDAAGHEVMHSFDVAVTDGKPTAGELAVGTEKRGRPERRPPAGGPAEPAATVDDTVVLAEKFREFHAADAGRAMAFYEPKARQIAVYETATGRLRGTIPVNGEDALFACGKDAVVVYTRGENLLERYDLATLHKTKAVPIGEAAGPKYLRMGQASAGPVYLFADGVLTARDGRTLEPMKLRGSLPDVGKDNHTEFRVSADGTAVVCWDPAAAPRPYTMVRVRDGAVTTTESATQFDKYNRRYDLTADGSVVLFGHEFYNRDGREIGHAEGVPNEHGFNAVPTADPRFFFRVGNPQRKLTDVSLCATATRESLATVRGLPDLGDYGGWDWPRCGTVHDSPDPGEPRVLYLPEAKRVAVVPVSDDRFSTVKLDLETAVGGAMTVVSVPPADVAVNGTYTYPVQVLPARPGLTYHVETGPAGLAVSAAGVVTWHPTGRPVGGTAAVVLTVADKDGHEATQSFDVAVTRGGPTPAPGGGGVGPIVKLDDRRIELPTAACYYTGGLVLAGDQLAVLADDGFTIRSTHAMPKVYSSVAARDGYYVAVCQKPPSIDVVDATTFKVVRSRTVAFSSLGEVAAHPTKAVCYVPYPHPGQDTRWHFLIFDERTADARTDDDWVGQWLAVAPSGEFLVAGSQKVFRTGTDLIDNPDRLILVPTYDSVERLIRYDLGDGVPQGAADKQDVGGGGVGVRLSPDGKRATYLSRTGSPRGSGCLGGWDPMELDKLPVAYGTKEAAAETTDLAFHPTRPLVAVPGKGTVAFFDRETGARVDPPADLAGISGDKVNRVYFSPDGKSLVVQTTVGPVGYLNRVALK